MLLNGLRRVRRRLNLLLLLWRRLGLRLLLGGLSDLPPALLSFLLPLGGLLARPLRLAGRRNLEVDLDRVELAVLARFFRLGLQSVGEVTEDGLIGLYDTPCIGMNDQEPAALINGVPF